MKKLKLKSEQLAKEEIMYKFAIADINFKKYKKERTKLLALAKDILKDDEQFTFKLFPHIKGYIQKVITKATRFDSTRFQKENMEIAEQYLVPRESITIVTDNVEIDDYAK
tara:strand:+ start:1236 stop:1568 length:333 start_codon:yes stop_codon:yes gene_type:complete